MKKTQQERVIYKLTNDSFITRNECLRQLPAITRLSAIIQNLEEAGWEFEAKDLPDRDYIYKVTKCPLRQVIYKVNGREIIDYVKQ